MENKEINPRYLGYRLLERGFSTWFLYMFRIINGSSFKVSPLHNELFNQFQYVYDKTITRINLNLCPRSSKTTMAKYFVVYCLTKNPKCQFIYTSFSQDLLSQISFEIMEIMENPVYKEMYSGINSFIEEVELDPIDEFWKDYLLKQHNRHNTAKYSSKKIITKDGGVVLFASIGSAITGFGCGIQGAKQFSGCLIIDDANKPADIRSELLRKKVHNYFTETLFTRLNNSDTAVVNIQQRLHKEDLSGFLLDTYGFDLFKYPLLIDGKCTLPEQYTPERVAELQKNNFTFSAQYQQEPIVEGGLLIKTEWFNRYDVIPDQFDNVFIVCDTAFSEKKSADYSVFTLFGIKDEKRFILDCYYKRVIYPELKRDLLDFYQKYSNKYYVQSIYIENKGSGISIIQDLRNAGLPIQELQPSVSNGYMKKEQISDKYTRLQEVIADLESGYVYLPLQASWLNEFILECEAFTGGKQNYKDDIVDTLIYGLKVSRTKLQVDWNRIKNVFIN